jgi:hypothetical protein
MKGRAMVSGQAREGMPATYNSPVATRTRTMLRIPGNLRRFLALPTPERRVFLSAFTRLPLFWIGLRLFGLERLQAWLQRKPLRDGRPQSPDDLMRLGALVNSAAHHALGPANCLTRSLYLCWLLRRKGIDGQLRIGVRLTEGVLEAHAWVEHAGIPINDRHDVGATFAAFTDPVSPSFFSAP